jgi:hypothetical protein
LEWIEKHVSNDKIGYLSYANINIALCYREQGDYNSSLVYCRKSLAMSDTIQSAEFVMLLYGVLSDRYMKKITSLIQLYYMERKLMVEQ